MELELKITIDTASDLFEFDGVKLSLNFLRTLTAPDHQKVYRIVRDGDQVIFYPYDAPLAGSDPLTLGEK